MNCRTVRQKLLADLDQLLPGTERREVAAHLLRCRPCADEAARRENVRSVMRALPRFSPPPELTVRLRVMASREIERRRRNWFRRTADRIELSFRDLMRPLAVPFAGGLFSTAFLFALLIPSFAFRIAPVHDVPIGGLSTEATVKTMAPFGFEDGEAVVDVLVDDQGHVVDFNIVSDETGASGASFQQSLENVLLFTEFTPPTAFGQPVSGRIRLTFRSSHVDVKG